MYAMSLHNQHFMNADLLERAPASDGTYHPMFDHMSDGYFLATENGFLLQVNPAFVHLLGYECKGEVIGLHLNTDVFVNTFDRVHLMQTARQLGHATARPVPLRRADGTSVETKIIYRHIRGENGHGDLFEAMIENSEETGRLESQLLQAQKLQSLGTLAGGMAHDINNMLTVIYGNASLLQVKVADDSELRRSIDAITKTCKRASNLTRNILAYSRNQSKQMLNLSFHVVAETVYEMMASMLEKKIALKTDLNPQLDRCLIDPAQMEQVLVNLCINARDAMPAGGTLTIETANRTIGSVETAPFPWALPGRYVAVTIRDTGSCMSPDVKAKVFEPFFTTKPVGKGTGLGLSMAFNIAKQHGGFITIASEPGIGTGITLLIPSTENLNQ